MPPVSPVPSPPDLPYQGNNPVAGETAQDYGSLEDFVAGVYGFPSFAAATRNAKQDVRLLINDLFTVANYPNTIRMIKQLKGEIQPPFDFTSHTADVLNQLLKFKEQGKLGDLTKHFISVIDVNADAIDNLTSETTGYSLELLIQLYGDKRSAAVEAAQKAADPITTLEDQINQMTIEGGKGHYHFKINLDHLDSYTKLLERFKINANGKFAFRKDTAPAPIAMYQCRIGASTFYVPPTQINVHQSFKAGSITNGVLRQPNSPKMNMGNSETMISMTLFFPNHESIWGFNGDKADFDIFNWDPSNIVQTPAKQILGQEDRMAIQKSLVSDETIDRYLSSLRGLIAQFKYAPFLPIKNDYINRVYDITAVAMMGMTVTTVPNFPFVVAVTLNMAKFNFNPFLPMIDHFDQAIHWGKFRQYMGKAAARLDAKVNQGFLQEVFSPGSAQPIQSDLDPNVMVQDQSTKANTITRFEGDLIPRFDKIADYNNGRFDFYFPITTPSRIFAADTTDFRQPGENNLVTKDIWDGILSTLGFNLVSTPYFDFFDYDKARRLYKYRNERAVLWQYLNQVNLAAGTKNDPLGKWTLMNTTQKDTVINGIVAADRKAGKINNYNEDAYRLALNNEWFFTIYDSFLADSEGFKKLLDSKMFVNSKYTINEWAVPMEKLSMDWSTCIVNNVSVSLSNNFATQQILLQDSPSYQHIGGGDSKIEVNMTIIGEENLIRFRRMFEHIDGLARIEKLHGVLGFLGIKNVLTALCGIKYVLPLDFEIDTRPNYPHVYDVNITFIDFDVMQQEREKLSSEQQNALVKKFGKRNPFLRLKQCWSFFNAYPDFPLDVRDEGGNILGHLDPDWYFRSFTTNNSDQDIFNWGFNAETLGAVTKISDLQNKIDDPGSYNLTDDDVNKIKNDLAKTEADLRLLLGDNQQLPPGWQMVDGHLEHEDASGSGMPEPDLIHYLGNYSADKKTIGFIAMFKGGFFALGSENLDTQAKTYHTGMSIFKDDLATNNLAGQKGVDGTTPLSDYQHEYEGGSPHANKQYEMILQDYAYRNNRGRMLKAFPTYMLWLIDEGGYFAGIKLFDNFYGLNSVIDFSVVQSEDCIGDTLVMRLSNIYQKLTTPFLNQFITENDPLFNTPIGHLINVLQNRTRNIATGLTDKLVEINSIRLKPGVRVHLRAGYGSNPNNLKTIFNGTIAEVEQGDIVTVIAQSDAIEFTGILNTVNPKGDSGKLDGNLTNGFWMSEPRDLMVRLLTMGSSNFKEWVSWGSKGVLFSESRFGIRHFGTILYEAMSESERVAQQNKILASAKALRTGESGITPSVSGNDSAGMMALLGQYTNRVSNITASTALPSMFNGTLVSIVKMLWLNQNAKRDYEIFKRNIYPGNGFGIAQYMAGDMIDGGMTVQGFIGSWSKAPSTGKDRAKKLVPSPPSENELDFIKRSDEIKKAYSLNRASDEKLLSDLSNPVKDTTDLTIQTPEDSGFLDDVLQVFEVGGTKVANGIFGFLDGVNQGISNALGGGILGRINAGLLETLVGGPMSVLALNGTKVLGGLLGGVGRLFSATNGIGHILGLNSGIADDDLKGFGEVAFRAQTYMKSVWDMFQLCAALLPNYIVAVRPFEDRSTLFYGKPHWLYTSGVIPITEGIAKDVTLDPKFDDVDQAQIDLLNKASQNAYASNENSATKADALQTIMNTKVGKNFDPYNPSEGQVVSSQTDVVLKLQKYLAENQKDSSLSVDDQKGLISYIQSGKATLLTTFGDSQLNEIFDWMFKQMGNDRAGSLKDIRTSYTDVMGKSVPHTSEAVFNAYVNWVVQGYYMPDFLDLTENSQGSDVSSLQTVQGYADSIFSKQETVNQIQSLLNKNDQTANLKDLFLKDPVAFAYQYGWKISNIDAFMDIANNDSKGLLVDPVGSAARKLYDEPYSDTVDSMNKSRSIREAKDIWRDFRNQFPIALYSMQAYAAAFPLEVNLKDAADAHKFLEGNSGKIYDITKATDQVSAALANSHFSQAMDLFMKFLWQDPFNRAWVVATATKKESSILATDFGIGDTSNNWYWDQQLAAWKVFLASFDNISIDKFGAVTSPETRKWMDDNRAPGGDAHNAVAQALTDVKNWWNDSIGGLIGMMGDVLSGFVSTIRMSLAQMGTAVGKAAEMQRQANILNATLNDSIYYQMGEPDSILRLVDNPFTREYGEPVIEVREPFQRIHFITSFDAILDNKITETSTGVPTVVTAVSDGKYPVTVHFDKGIPPNRQVEKVVETGLLWDNAMGSGLFGFLQPLLHPLETMRSLSKTLTGSSDQLSARRVALWHLKEGLKDIYTGEVTIVGDADIRPYDLLYIADASNRMYGMVEVEQVIHHFTPETGFITSITPNAIVTVNDPTRWTLLSWMWSKMSNYSLRDDVRATMAVRAERSVAAQTNVITQDDVYKYFGTQMNGAIQYTQGSTAFIKDIGAMYTGGGIQALTAKDKMIDQLARIDLMTGAAKTFSPLLGAAGGFVLTGGNPAGAVVGGVGAWAVSDLIWDAWQWVKDNLLDQHGCYIQYLNKDGIAMDGGLSYASGVAVGTNHTVSLFPSIMGIPAIRSNYKDANGNYRITTNDLLASLGWSEQETVSLYRDASIFVSNVNTQILKIAARSPQSSPNDNYKAVLVELLEPAGKFYIDPATGKTRFYNGVEDADSIWVRAIPFTPNSNTAPRVYTNPNGGGLYKNGAIFEIRFSVFNAYELQHHNLSSTPDFNETSLNDKNDLALLGYQYLVDKFADPNTRHLAIRIDTNDEFDTYGRTVATIFHNVPLGTSITDRDSVLMQYAAGSPPIPFDAYLPDGRPYTLNWEMIMTGYGQVDMRESLWNTNWRAGALSQGQ